MQIDWGTARNFDLLQGITGIGFVKLAVMAAVSEVNDKAYQQPDDEANLGRERQARNQIEAGENA